MENRYTGVFEPVGDWWIGHVEELPGCNVRERSLAEARDSLKEAIQLIVQGKTTAMPGPTKILTPVLNRICTAVLGCWLYAVGSAAQDGAVNRAAAVRSQVDVLYPDLERLYTDLHRNPELSLQEARTASILANHLRRLGFEVTTGVGGHGVVGLLKNGDGATVMVRTDMDALPIEEKTGLPYASRVTTKDDAGIEVPVMHACAHDIHMASWVGTAAILSKASSLWRGTLMVVAQPAEERLLGAKAMLADGLFTRFPKPDLALAIHQNASMKSGTVGVTAGYNLANCDSVDVTIFGQGGHGAYPHTTVDPIVIAARTILTLQTIVARENDPFEPAVVTVGSIHGGTKHNIIPDEVRLQLTVRSYKPEVRERILAAITRIVTAEAAAAQAPQPPSVKVVESVKATYSDPALAARVAARLRLALGEQNVLAMPPVLGAEDFSDYLATGMPGLFVWVGVVEPARFEAAKAGGPPPPGSHSALFAPDREATLRTAVLAESLAVLELFENQ